MVARLSIAALAAAPAGACPTAAARAGHMQAAPAAARARIAILAWLGRHLGPR